MAGKRRFFAFSGLGSGWTHNLGECVIERLFAVIGFQLIGHGLEEGMTLGVRQRGFFCARFAGLGHGPLYHDLGGKRNRQPR